MAAVWAAVEEFASRAAVMTAAATVVSLVPEDEKSAEVATRAALATRYATVRPFLAVPGESKALDATSASLGRNLGSRGSDDPARSSSAIEPGAAAGRYPDRPDRIRCDVTSAHVASNPVGLPSGLLHLPWIIQSASALGGTRLHALTGTLAARI